MAKENVDICDKIEQYSFYKKFSCMSRYTDMPEDYAYLEKDSDVIPEFDFSESRPFSVFRIGLDIPVLSPYLSRQLVADLCDISVEELEKIINGKAFVYYLDSPDGTHKIGDVVDKALITWEEGKDLSLQSGYAIAYLLYLKDYYRKDELGDYYTNLVSPRAQKALDALDEYDLTAEDVFIRNILAPTEIKEAFKAIIGGKVNARNYFTDELYSIYNLNRRARMTFTQNIKLVHMANYSVLQRHVDEYFQKLWALGFIFEDNYHIKSN